MNILSRKEAKLEGCKFYFTGIECINGHLTYRYVSDGHCKSCNAEKSKRWRINNPQLSRDSIRLAYYKRMSLQSNREAERLRSKKKYKDNPGYYCTKSRIRENNLSKHYASLSSVEKLEIKILYEESYMLGPKWHVDHIIPLSKGGKHHPSNLQIVSAKYNLWKNDRILQ